MIKGFDFKKLMINVKNKPESMRGNKLLPCFVMLCGLFLCFVLIHTLTYSKAATNCSGTFNNGLCNYTFTDGELTISSDTVQTIANDFIANDIISNNGGKFRKSDITFVVFANNGSNKTLVMNSLDSTFLDCNSVKTIDFSGVDLSNCTSLKNAFKNCNEVKNLYFSEDFTLGNISQNGLDYMFYTCLRLQDESIQAVIDKIDLSVPHSFESTFTSCDKMKILDLSNKNFTNKYLNINGSCHGMFFGCTSLQELTYTISDDGDNIITNCDRMITYLDPVSNVVLDFSKFHFNFDSVYSDGLLYCDGSSDSNGPKKIYLPSDLNDNAKNSTFINNIIKFNYVGYDSNDEIIYIPNSTECEIKFSDCNNPAIAYYGEDKIVYQDDSWGLKKYFLNYDVIDHYDISNDNDDSMFVNVYNNSIKTGYYDVVFAGSSDNGNVTIYDPNTKASFSSDYDSKYRSKIEKYFAGSGEYQFIPTSVKGMFYDINFGYDSIDGLLEETDYSKLLDASYFIGGSTYIKDSSIVFENMNFNMNTLASISNNKFIDIDCVETIYPSESFGGNLGFYSSSNQELYILYEAWSDDTGFYEDLLLTDRNGEYVKANLNNIGNNSYYENLISNNITKDSRYEYCFIELVNTHDLIRTYDNADYFRTMMYVKEINKDTNLPYGCVDSEVMLINNDGSISGFNDVGHINKLPTDIRKYSDKFNGIIYYYTPDVMYYEHFPSDRFCTLLFEGNQGSSDISLSNLEAHEDEECLIPNTILFSKDGFIANNLCNFCFMSDSLVSFDGTYLNTESVTDMSYMFESCSSLKEVVFDKNYNTDSCISFLCAFSNCSALEKVDISSFTSRSVSDNSDYEHMFDCFNLKLKYIDISSLDFSNGTPTGNNEVNLNISEIYSLELIKIPKKVDDEDSIILPYDKWFLLDEDFDILEKYNSDILIGQDYRDGACYLTNIYVDAEASSDTSKYKDEFTIKSNNVTDKILKLYENTNGTYTDLTKSETINASIDYSYLYESYKNNLLVNVTNDFLHEIGNGFDLVDFDNDGIDDYLFVYIRDSSNEEYPEKFSDFVSNFYFMGISNKTCVLPIYALAVVGSGCSDKISLDTVSNNINSFEDLMTFGNISPYIEPYNLNIIAPDIELAMQYYDTEDDAVLKEPMTKDKLKDIKDYILSHEENFLLTNLEMKEKYFTSLQAYDGTNFVILTMFPLHVSYDSYDYNNEFKLSDLEAGTHVLELRHKDFETLPNEKIGRSNSVNVVINKLNLQEEGTNNKLIAKIDDNGIEAIDKDSFDKSKINEYISKLKVYYINNIGDEKLLELNKDYTVNHYENDDKCIIEITGKGSCTNSYNFKIGDMDAPDPVKPEPKKPDNDPQGGGSSDKPNITTQTIAIGGTPTVISGYVNGYNDKSFKPNKSITRGEFSKMVASLQDNFNLNDVTNLNSTNTYTDVNAKKYYAPYIGFLTKCKVINGYTDKTFKPEDNITRAEVCKILSNMYVVSKIKDNANYDKEISGKWYEESVRKMIEADLIKGYPDGKFKPDEDITRAEVVALLNRIRNVNYRELTDYQKNYIKDNYNDIDTNAWYYKDLCYALTNMK